MIKVGSDDIMEVLMDSEEIVKAYYRNYLVYVKPIRQPSYIKNGLVFWLDGIDKGNVTGAWVEKKQGYVFTNHGATFNTNHVYFDGEAYLDNSEDYGVSTADGTIEVVYEKEPGDGILFAAAYSNGSKCSFGYVSNFLLWSSRTTSRARYSERITQGSVSISLARALGNGVGLTQSSSGNLVVASNSPSYVGRRNTGNASQYNYFTGKIYCIRIYNRQLTEEEVLYNYNIDCQRFNLDWQEYITFADPYVEQICVTTWGDGTHMTKGQAAVVSTLELNFGGNTNIESFDELRYFTGLSTFGSNNPGTFNNCTSLTSVTIPVISDSGGPGSQSFERAFTGCTSLATVTMLGRMTPLASSGAYYFNNCSSLTRVNVPNITVWMQNFWNYDPAPPFNASSGGRIYINNVEVTDVVVPSDITVVNPRAFYKCIGITSVTTHSGVINYRKSAFFNCTALKEIHFGGPVTITETEVFSGCSSLTKAYFNSVADLFDSDFYTWNSSYPRTYGLFGTSKEGHIYINGTEYTNVVVPNTVTTIGASLFLYCTSITSLSFEANSSLTTIKAGAFYGCSGLTSISSLPNVTTIGTNAFAYCSGLSSITVPSSVTSAPMSAFIYSGHKEGKLYIGGDLTGQNNTYFGYGEVEIAGDFISSGAGHQFGRAAEQEPSIYDFILRVGGDLTKTTSGRLFYALNVVFIEIGGQFTWSGGEIGSLKSGCIVHLGYDGIAGVVSSSNFGATNIAKVYVGDGSSAAHDNAILAQYTADTDWSAYSSKLDTWYNYINDPNANPDFIN